MISYTFTDGHESVGSDSPRRWQAAGTHSFRATLFSQLCPADELLFDIGKHDARPKLPAPEGGGKVLANAGGKTARTHEATDSDDATISVPNRAHDPLDEAISFELMDLTGR